MADRPGAVPTLDELTADPTLAGDLPRPEALRLLVQVEGLAAVLRVAAVAAAQSSTREADLLDAEQAGRLLGLTARQVYRRANRWPFTRRLGPKTLRFDRAGLESYLGRSRA